MLDDFIEEQPKVTRILKNSVKKNHISHAYLFEANGYKNKKNLAIAFAKMLLCPNNYSNSLNCVNCTQCQNIDKNIFPELKIIEPDGLWIKKDTLDNLQKEFSKKSILSNKRVYIINNVERLNTSSANSILKFLEEPEENIIAILITDNIHQLLDTIVSRCEIICFARKSYNTNNTLECIKNQIVIPKGEKYTDDVLNNMIEKALDFVDFYEHNGLDTILKIQKLWHNNFVTKEEILFAIDLLILFYKDLLNIKLNRNINTFFDYEEELKKYDNKILILYKKINVLIKTKQKINYNVNSSLLIDKMILELERCD